MSATPPHDLRARHSSHRGRVQYRTALNEALAEEMRRDPKVFVLGEGIGERGGSYKVTQGLRAEFGAGRVIDTPLAEASFTGVGIGAALTGMPAGRPVSAAAIARSRPAVSRGLSRSGRRDGSMPMASS
ncbi:MAG TPA: hypothetical protein P5022_16810, partial [Candidatus Paceibacterota bacterium]|nr:hypothetical protein [Candidatus Paceibacterota bacterium]